MMKNYQNFSLPPINTSQNPLQNGEIKNNKKYKISFISSSKASQNFQQNSSLKTGNLKLPLINTPQNPLQNGVIKTNKKYKISFIPPSKDSSLLRKKELNTNESQNPLQKKDSTPKEVVLPQINESKKQTHDTTQPRNEEFNRKDLFAESHQEQFNAIGEFLSLIEIKNEKDIGLLNELKNALIDLKNDLYKRPKEYIPYAGEILKTNRLVNERNQNKEFLKGEIQNFPNTKISNQIRQEKIDNTAFENAKNIAQTTTNLILNFAPPGISKIKNAAELIYQGINYAIDSINSSISESNGIEDVKTLKNNLERFKGRTIYSIPHYQSKKAIININTQCLNRNTKNFATSNNDVHTRITNTDQQRWKYINIDNIMKKIESELKSNFRKVNNHNPLKKAIKK
jgi:hypothetical protein